MSAYIQSQEKIFNEAIEDIDWLEYIEDRDNNRSMKLVKRLDNLYNKIMLCVLNARQYEDF